MQFRLGHSALQAEEKMIVVLPRIVDAIFIDDQSVGERTDLDEPVPVAAGARQAGRLQTEDRSGRAQTDLGHEHLEAIATSDRGPRMGLILIDDANGSMRPAQV